MLVPDGMSHWQRVTPDQPAIMFGEAALTYGELGARVERLAAALQAIIGTRPGLHVALLVEPAPDFLVAFLAVVRAGAVAVPLSPSWSEVERDRALNLCDAVLVISSGRADTGSAVAMTTLDELEQCEGREPALLVAPDHPFYAGFTSGSSGSLRAVVREHRSWVASFFAMSIEFGIGPGQRVLVPGSLFFSFSLIAALHALYVGSTVVIPDHSGPRSLLAAMSRGADALYVLPSVLLETLLLGGRRDASFPHVRRVICAGEPLSRETRELVAGRCPSAGLYEYYGASELGFVTLSPPVDGASRPTSVGRPFFGTSVAVLRPDGSLAGSGEAGLLCARTPYGGVRYLGGPALDDALDHHGWRTVGDYARLDDDGYVYLVGRRDRMTVIRGENVWPEEVERVLAEVPGVERVAVVPEPASHPTHLVAFVEGANALDARELLSRCRRALAPRAVPRRIVTIDQLPSTPTGKVDYAGVARLLAARQGSGGG